MPLLREHPWYAESNAYRLTLVAFLLIAAIAVLDALLLPDIGLEFLYVVPLFVATAFMSRAWQLGLFSAVCAIFSQAFSIFWDSAERVPRIVFAFLGFFFIALMSRKLAAFSRAASRRLSQLEEELALRHQSEEQLELLLNSSSAGVVTVSPEGRIRYSNRAAHQIFGVEPGGLTGQRLAAFLPGLDPVGSSDSGVMKTCPGVRANGNRFIALVALSRSSSAADRNLTAVILDAEEVPSAIATNRQQ